MLSLRNIVDDFHILMLVIFGVVSIGQLFSSFGVILAFGYWSWVFLFTNIEPLEAVLVQAFPYTESSPR